MRKSTWLISAGLFALSTPAFAQQTTTDTDGAQAQPTQGATAEGAAVSKTGVQPQTAEQTNTADVGDIVVTATRRNEALSDVPLAVSAITAADAGEFGRHRYPPADPGQPLTAGLLDLVRSRRGRGPHPRHRHRRRQPRP
jgi:hypothetical protein